MQEAFVTALISGAIAALVTSLFVPPVIKVAKAIGAMDHPGGRRQHTASVPRLGGVAMALGHGHLRRVSFGRRTYHFFAFTSVRIWF